MSDAISTVEYRDVPGFPGYRVGSDGSVWSCLPSKKLGWNSDWKRLKHYVNDNGYCIIGLRLAGKPRDFRVHQLVALAFIGDCPAGQEVRHGNGNRQDNRRDNLSYGTRAQNMADAIRHGTTTRGERGPRATMTNAEALEIRLAVRSGRKRQCEIARERGISPATVCEIVSGKNHWKNLDTIARTGDPS